jgi:hypothetical protein
MATANTTATAMANTTATAKTNAGVLRCAQNDSSFFGVTFFACKRDIFLLQA